MIKKVSLLIIMIFLAQGVFATSFDINKSDRGNVVISELGNPAVFEFFINNLDSAQEAQVYSFVGLTMTPNGYFDLTDGLNRIEVKAYPNTGKWAQKGLYNFEYELNGKVSGITKDVLMVKVVNFDDAISFRASDINVGSENVEIEIVNKENTNLENTTFHFTSLFFDDSAQIDLKPYGTAKVTLKINQEGIKTLTAGAYIFDVNVQDIESEGTVNYAPKEDSTLSKDGVGFVVRKTTYTRTNTGNIIVNGKVDVTKDILSRLFTINSVEPSEVTRGAVYATYSWEKSLKPGESYSVSTTTNYTFPFILLIIIVVIGFLVKIYTRTSVVIDKRVSYVKTRGGEFALKVKLHVKAKKYVENVQLIDRLPGMTKLYEKFGVMPDKMDPATRRLFWNIERLNAGEERVYSYIIYSKVNVVGRFELPSATVTFVKEGKSEQVFSNRTFFVADTMRTDL